MGESVLIAEERVENFFNGDKNVKNKITNYFKSPI